MKSEEAPVSTNRQPATTSVFAGLGLMLLAAPVAVCQTVRAEPHVVHATRHGVSKPLRDIEPAAPLPGPPRVIQRHWAHPPKVVPALRDSALQKSPGPVVSYGQPTSFEGLGASQQAAVTGILFAPPDTNGATGKTQFVQWVNYALAVFDKKTGAISAGPIAGNGLWASDPNFKNSQCATNNSGDPIAQYDKTANRWVLTQPVFTKPFAICVAVSITSDATGNYHLYEFDQVPIGDYFPDYPKLGIWPDGYYMSIDQYTGLGFGGNFKGALTCAFDRSAMLAGADSPTMICRQAGPYQSLLPSDLDGHMQPPSGSPNFFVNLGTNSLNLWKFHVDFVTPTNSTLTGPLNIPVRSFSEACGGGICIPQAGTNRLLDSLGDRVMYRLAYRNFGDHASLVVNHSVTNGSSVGVRWYELRNPSSCSPDPAAQQYCVYQQGTFAPDTNFRWMGSIAMDKSGDIAIGYSVSARGIHPSIGITGRTPTDPAGTLETEKPVFIGTGSQLNVSNWGDYSSMGIDPVDDCTFWYTTEYLPTDGKYTWHTRIASFAFPKCH